MKQNLGLYDKLIRLAIAITLLFLYAFNIINGESGTVGLVLAMVLTFTTLINFSPFYAMFKINTRE